MRIVHYCRHALAGESGVANSARGWAQALAGLGHHVALVVDAAQRVLDDVPGVPTVPLRHRRTGGVSWPSGLGSVLEDDDLLVVHGGWHPANNVAATIARRRGVPLVVLTHGVYYPAALDRGRVRKQVWAWAAERRMLRGAEAVHLLFRQEQAGLQRLGVAPPIVVAPNGVRVPPGQRWDGGSGGYVAYLGRYDPTHKGLDLLLTGLAHLPRDRRPHLRMHGPDWHDGRSKVATLVRTLGLADSVTVGDPLYGQAKWSLLTEARGLVLPSRWEASPMSLAEAAALGLPALVTDFPMGRLLAEAGAAIEVDRTPAAVASGLLALTGSTSAAVGRRARVFAEEHLSWEAVARSWLDQIEALPFRSGSR